MSDLKPCPFCGGKAIGAPSCRPEWVYEIKCTDCGAKIKKLAICPSCARREAIEAWNTRHERTCTVANLGGRPDSLPILLCESCGAFTYSKADGSTWSYCPNCGAKVVE